MRGTWGKKLTKIEKVVLGKKAERVDPKKNKGGRIEKNEKRGRTKTKKVVYFRYTLLFARIDWGKKGISGTELVWQANTEKRSLYGSR